MKKLKWIQENANKWTCDVTSVDFGFAKKPRKVIYEITYLAGYSLFESRLNFNKDTFLLSAEYTLTLAKLKAYEHFKNWIGE